MLQTFCQVKLCLQICPTAKTCDADVATDVWATWRFQPVWQQKLFCKNLYVKGFMPKLPQCVLRKCLFVASKKTVEGFASLQKAMHIVAKRSGDMVKYTGKEKIP